jgi:hypothetical protein
MAVHHLLTNSISMNSIHNSITSSSQQSLVTGRVEALLEGTKALMYAWRAYYELKNRIFTIYNSVWGSNNKLKAEDHNVFWHAECMRGPL